MANESSVFVNRKYNHYQKTRNIKTNHHLSTSETNSKSKSSLVQGQLKVNIKTGNMKMYTFACCSGNIFVLKVYKRGLQTKKCSSPLELDRTEIELKTN